MEQLRMTKRDQTDADLLATRRAWRALDGWEIVKTFAATKGMAIHTVMRKEEEYRCTCADYVYRRKLCKHIAEIGGKKVAPPVMERTEPDLIVDLEGGLEEALALMLAQRDVLWVPQCWDWLLADELPTPCKKGPAKALDDRAPCRNDIRIARVRRGEYEVQARLRSGQTNYWLEFAVVRGTKVVYEGTSDGRAKEVEFEVPTTEVRLLLKDAELSVTLKRYGTKNAGKRRR